MYVAQIWRHMRPITLSLWLAAACLTVRWRTTGINFTHNQFLADWLGAFNVKVAGNFVSNNDFLNFFALEYTQQVLGHRFAQDFAVLVLADDSIMLLPSGHLRLCVFSSSTAHGWQILSLHAD